MSNKYQFLKADSREYKTKKDEVAIQYELSFLTEKGDVLVLGGTKDSFNKAKELGEAKPSVTLSIELSPRTLRAIAASGKEYTANVINVRVTDFVIVK
jgi:hypothetical protein